MDNAAPTSQPHLDDQLPPPPHPDVASPAPLLPQSAPNILTSTSSKVGRSIPPVASWRGGALSRPISTQPGLTGTPFVPPRSYPIPLETPHSVSRRTMKGPVVTRVSNQNVVGLGGSVEGEGALGQGEAQTTGLRKASYASEALSSNEGITTGFEGGRMEGDETGNTGRPMLDDDTGSDLAHISRPRSGSNLSPSVISRGDGATASSFNPSHSTIPLQHGTSLDPLIDFPLPHELGHPLSLHHPSFLANPPSPIEEGRSPRMSLEAVVQKARNSFSLSRAGSPAPQGSIEEQVRQKKEKRESPKLSKRDSPKLPRREEEPPREGANSSDYDHSNSHAGFVHLKSSEGLVSALPGSDDEMRRNLFVSSPTSPTPPTPDHRHARILDERGRPVRNYRVFPGRVRFLLGGRIATSKDNPTPFLVSLCLAIILPAAFLIFNSGFLWTHLEGGGKAALFIFVWLAALMITNMLVSSFREPGIIPRNLDSVPQRKWVPDLKAEGVGGWKAEPKFFRVREGVIASKWCETCETYRPPRTSHCRLCDNCSLSTDHHCSFLNNCIGRRNYFPFIVFLTSATLISIYCVGFSIYHVAHESSSLSDWRVIGSLLVAILSFILLIPVTSLLFYHLRLLALNRTTIEQLRPKGERSGGIDPASGEATGNLFALNSKWANVFVILCRPAGASFIEPRAYVVVDQREEPGRTSRV